jgi:hypothetical protein
VVLLALVAAFGGPFAAALPDLHARSAITGAVRKLLDALYAHIAPPGDATHVATWDDADGQVSRYFRGTKRGTEARRHRWLTERRWHYCRAGHPGR